MRSLFSVMFFLWLAALLALTFWPDLPDMKVRFHGDWFRTDYLGHAGFYAVLALLFLFWQSSGKGKPGRSFLVLSAIAGLALGLLTETVQYFIPGRSVNPFDLMYNCIGIVLGILAYLLVKTLPLNPKGDFNP